MQQAVFHQFTNVNVRYAFKIRNYSAESPCAHKDLIDKEIDNLCKLRFTEEELDYLRKIPFLTDDYIDFLRMFQLKRDDIRTYNSYSTSRGKFFQLIIEGSWLNTILFETPVLAIISEILNTRSTLKSTKKIGSPSALERLNNKILDIQYTYNNVFTFADFGTRRRYSKQWHEKVIFDLKREVPSSFIGTSNVYFAKKYNLKPIGTMAHEFIQAMQAIVRLKDSQKYALQCWADEYRGNLGIALSDTLGIDAFLNDFDLYFVKLFDGVRIDSGNPFDSAEKVLEHYEKLGIDSKTKTIVFSDGLTLDKCIKLNSAFNEEL